MTTRSDEDYELGQHLRRTLGTVAATVQEDSADQAIPAPLERARGHRRHRRLLVGAGVIVAALPLAAAAIVGVGPEYVDQIPPPNPIVSGSIDGKRYWVVDNRKVTGCEGFPSGVELIAEEHNVIGREWNTVGAFFGEPTADGCAPRVTGDPPEYTYYSDGGLMVGDGMLWMGALHPDIDQVLVSFGEGEPFDAATFRHEGGTYYVLEVPPNTATFTVEYLVDGDVVVPPSGERVEHVVRGD